MAAMQTCEVGTLLTPFNPQHSRRTMQARGVVYDCKGKC